MEMFKVGNASIMYEVHGETIHFWEELATEGL